jgi:xanthine dehydrogenase accessory factor
VSSIILMRGGGDLASGAAIRLARAGLRVVITELPQPLAVRRLVSFAQAVYSQEITIEGITAHLARDVDQARQLAQAGMLAVLVDAPAQSRFELQPVVMIDGRMTKRPPELGMEAAPLVVGLGPGFTAGIDCHAVIETCRGPHLGRVIWQGAAEADTGVPDGVLAWQAERVLRAPVDGPFTALAQIGERLAEGQAAAEVDGQVVRAVFKGVLRGILADGVRVTRGMKIGDVDPRDDPALCRMVSDKALAVGGGVMEAILSRADIRERLWE